MLHFTISIQACVVCLLQGHICTIAIIIGANIGLCAVEYVYMYISNSSTLLLLFLIVVVVVVVVVVEVVFLFFREN